MSPRSQWALFAAFLLLPLSASAQTPPDGLVGFQGRLTDAAGNPVNATVPMVFTLYDAESGGVAVWTESRSVAVTGGLYGVLLGEGAALDPAAFDKPLWLGVAVNGDPEMTPRCRLASAPYALVAKQAASASALQGRPVASTAPAAGQVLKWDGAAWAPAADAGTTYGAGDGLTLTGSTFAAAYAGSGGDLGSALSLARSDHVHDGLYYTKGAVDTALAAKLSLAGGTMTGALAINTAAGTTGLSVSADATVGGSLSAATGAFTGNVSAAAPTLDAHLVTLGYLRSQPGTFVGTATAVLDFPAVGNNKTADLTMTLNGVQVGDTIALGIPPLVMFSGVFVIGYVSSPDTVTIRYGVIGVGGGYDPPPALFRVTVIRYP